MERSSRSKRSYYYDQDYDAETLSRTARPRYNHHYSNPSPIPRHRGAARQLPPSKTLAGDPSLTVTTSFRILCHDLKAGGVIGKSGSIIKSIRQHTGAWINVHELMPGDEERIIEISDTRRRDPDGRMPSFSPAQEALFLIHERILESDGEHRMSYGGGGTEDEEEFGVRGNRAVTRLVVSKMHVGCLLGKGGKIIEQMRMETKTQIRILPRDHTLPRCVSMSEEIVQVVGDVTAVKNAIAIISSRLRESQHRDRSQFHGRLHSSEQFFPPDDDYIPHVNSSVRRSSVDGPGSRPNFGGVRGNSYSSRQSGLVEHGDASMADNSYPFCSEDLVFRILCPTDRLERVVGGSDGIVDLLQDEIGVDVKVADIVAGSDEQIIIISSDEGPDDELFPAQEALLHIQTCIVDILPDKDNTVNTRLLVPSSEIECLDGRDSSLSEMKKVTGANIQILSRSDRPAFVSETDELVQITGEIKAARNALVEVTSRLRSYIYREFYHRDTLSSGTAGSMLGMESVSSTNIMSGGDVHKSVEHPSSNYQNVPTIGIARPSKETVDTGNEIVRQNDSARREDVPTVLSRLPVPLVTRSTLEVVIPEQAARKLITKSKNMLAQISELSGANVSLVEERPDVTNKIIQISGTPEQAERAQSLLQGFILSTQEDGP